MRLVEHERRDFRRPRTAGLELLREQVAEQHHALRMAVREDGELAQRFAGIEPLGLEPPGQIGEHVLEREPLQRQRIRLTEQGPLAGVEQLAHHRRLRSGVDVGGGVAVVLDDRPQEAVQILSRDEQVLELVEDHERRGLVALAQRLREIEQPVHDRLGGLGVRRRRPRADRHARARRADAQAEPREQPRQVGAHPGAVERRVGGDDAASRVGHVGHAREVDVRRPPAGLAQLRRMGQQEARLPVPARRREPHADAVAGAAAERRELLLPVDQQVGSDGSLEAEGCSLGHCLVRIYLTTL